jgi:hypothetical protein
MFLILLKMEIIKFEVGKLYYGVLFYNKHQSIKFSLKFIKETNDYLYFKQDEMDLLYNKCVLSNKQMFRAKKRSRPYIGKTWEFVCKKELPVFIENKNYKCNFLVSSFDVV